MKVETLKILVTGGAGFIGSNFIRFTQAHRRNAEIVIFDKLTYAADSGNVASLRADCELVVADICNAEAVDKAVQAADLVVHFAAETHNDNSIDNPSPFFETNVMGTLNVVQAVTKFGKRLHHISTDEVFGDLPIGSTQKFTTASPYRPSSPYSASKAASDHLVRAWIRTFGTHATISNCSNNFGPYQHTEKLIPQIIRAISAGEKPKLYGSGNNVRDWIHVDDHSDAIWAILDKQETGSTYLIGANNLRSNIEVTNAILRYLGMDEGEYELVPDRPGHDQQYAIDVDEMEVETGWRAVDNDFENQIPAVVDFYLERFKIAGSSKHPTSKL